MQSVAIDLKYPYLVTELRLSTIFNISFMNNFYHCVEQFPVLRSFYKNRYLYKKIEQKIQYDLHF